jgi:succinoglycan biosynthesis transport protein ExoP
VRHQSSLGTGGRLQGSTSLQRPITITPYTSEGRRELTWGQLFHLLSRNRLLAFAILFVVSGLVFLATMAMTPEYQATTRLEIDPPGAETLSLHDSANVNPPPHPEYLETQAQILRSDELALEVIRTLKLDKQVTTDEVSGKKTNIIRDAMQKIRGLLRKPTSPAQISVDNGANVVVLTPAETAALRSFQKHLSVTVMRNTDLVDVSFAATDPRLAAMVTNTVADHFIERNQQMRVDKAMQATGWLSKQLDDLREKVEKSNDALAQFQNANGIVDIDEKQNTTTQTVEDLTRQLNAAKGDRIQLEAEVKSLNESGVDALAVARSNLLLQDLSRMLAETSAHLAEAQVVYGDNNANVRKYRNQVNELQNRLQGERNRIAQSVRASYNSAAAREQLLTKALDGMKGKVHEMNETVVRNSTLKKQVQVNEDLYNNLSTKLKEAGIAAGLRSSTIRVLDRARIPDRPFKPQVMMNLAIGGLLGLILAIGIPLLKELLTDRVRVPEDVRALTGLSPIGVVPLIAGWSARKRRPVKRPWLLDEAGGANGQVASIYTPSSIGAEAVRNLSSLVRLSRPHMPPKTILVTSASPGEGKTTVATRLALVLAESNRTCLLDADLRNPSIGPAFGISNAKGLAEVLVGSRSIESVMLEVPGVKNLAVVPGGMIASTAGELILSESMRRLLRALSQQFDHIVIDSPPIVPFADARALSQMVDGVLLIGRSGVTKSNSLYEALEILEQVHASLLGIILNGMVPKASYYRTYKSYGGYAREG